MTVRLIYIGDRFYDESGTFMSSIYAENGERYDWHRVGIDVARGETVEIRRATAAELYLYEGKLIEWKLKRVRERERLRVTAAPCEHRWAYHGHGHNSAWYKCVECGELIER